ncbi:putative membrane protein [Chromohalobacter marismortui]|uniref:Putative membrane protein n=1 Tax=Chromohalobacter marismortui TaxID=42055 RepID=A0A4R7NL97_9GAMM|nr:MULTISPECIES: DUF368 domain-containing protein [Chromohalobacter]MCI0510119.1 DUF368 domain-containing protein [Chromohalobacter sp.]MCI0594830.1 DUF368 domain-containing protein [Chromohalobacter sp.]TDU21534.1 putative membrane protein [Chromohalobacter marismortui]
MKRYLTLFFKGAGMGAADAVPGVSGGTIAFITGIYEELIDSIKQFGPRAFGVGRREGLTGLVTYLNLAFLLPLLSGIVASLVSVAHLVTWLLAHHQLLLNAFFFGLVLASAVVVGRQIGHWQWRHVMPLMLGVCVALWLPSLLPAPGEASQWVLVVGGAIAISAMLLPGVSGSFLLLVMGLYGTVMEGVKSADLSLIATFGAGCVIGLMVFSRVLSWLFHHYRLGTLLTLVGFILGSLPQLWPWRELASYRLASGDKIVPLDYRYLMPSDYSAITGEPAHLLTAIALMIAGLVLVMVIGERSPSPFQEDRTHV